MNNDVNPCGTGGAEQEEYADMSQALVGYSDPDQMIKKAFEAMSRMEKAAFCTEVAVKLKTHGYVYVAWNPLFPTLIKIGATARTNPFIRLKELSTAGVPGVFVLVCCMATMTPFQLEKQVHAHFKERRSFGFRKEFFEVSVDEVVAYFDTLSAGCGPVQSVAKVVTTNSAAVKRGSGKNGDQTSVILEINKKIRELQEADFDLNEAIGNIHDREIRNLQEEINQAVKEAFKSKDESIRFQGLYNKACKDTARLLVERTALENENKRLKVDNANRHETLLSVVQGIAKDNNDRHEKLLSIVEGIAKSLC